MVQVDVFSRRTSLAPGVNPLVVVGGVSTETQEPTGTDTVCTTTMLVSASVGKVRFTIAISALGAFFY